jgi:uncharacterized protein
MHAGVSQTVDVILALILIAGGVVGAQLGVVLAKYIHGHYARVLLALLILAVCLRRCMELFITPADIFTAEMF